MKFKDFKDLIKDVATLLSLMTQNMSIGHFGRFPTLSVFLARLKCWDVLITHFVFMYERLHTLLRHHTITSDLRPAKTGLTNSLLGTTGGRFRQVPAPTQTPGLLFREKFRKRRS